MIKKTVSFLMDAVAAMRYVNSEVFQEGLNARIGGRASKYFLGMNGNSPVLGIKQIPL
ncbi:hypothetical protein OHD51_00710 [Escherichia coli]|nr:hypothetical protein [Escherichia coli]